MNGALQSVLLHGLQAVLTATQENFYIKVLFFPTLHMDGIFSSLAFQDSLIELDLWELVWIFFFYSRI